MGNRPQQPDNNRAAPQCDSEINSSKKVPKRRKYEGKRLEASFSVSLPRKLARIRNQSFCQGDFPVVHSCCRKFLKHVHNLFTRALWLPSPAGLRLEISCESDKKKMNLIFDYDKKFSLTGKMKHACRRENKKQCVEKISREPTATDSESPRRTDFAADCLRIPS